MEKKLILFVSCLLLALIPSSAFGQTSIQIDRNTPPPPPPQGPQRGSVFEIVSVEANQQTSELCVTFLQNIPNVSVSLTKNGVNYEENGLNAVSGQSLAYNLVDYETGVYMLTIEVEDTIMEVYTVTITEE